MPESAAPWLPHETGAQPSKCAGGTVNANQMWENNLASHFRIVSRWNRYFCRSVYKFHITELELYGTSLPHFPRCGSWVCRMLHCFVRIAVIMWREWRNSPKRYSHVSCSCARVRPRIVACVYLCIRAYVKVCEIVCRLIARCQLVMMCCISTCYGVHFLS